MENVADPKVVAKWAALLDVGVPQEERRGS
jgi:hypothetical protein